MEAPPSTDLQTPQRALAEAAREKAINADLAARVALLELQNEKMRRARYGLRSGLSQRLIDQMELSFEELKASASDAGRAR